MAAKDCISFSEVVVRLRRGEPIALADLRTPEEFASGDIDGAVNLSIELLPAEAARRSAAPAVVTVCPGGRGRSEKAAHLLREKGVGAVFWLCGGLREWQKRRMHEQGVSP
jgi:rhodanese-related sulfurtransferase